MMAGKGIAMTEDRQEHYLALVEFCLDLVHPEQLGYAVTDEVRARASRLLKIQPEVTEALRQP